MRPGARVQHPQFGEGTIVEVRPHGSKSGVQVDFGYMEDWVSWEELGLEEEAASLSKTTQDGSGSVSDGIILPKLTEDVVGTRRAILALKLGQVLEENILELSTGTDDIEASLEQKVAATAQQQAGSILFKGSWGSGKTHLLTMLTALATKYQLATASVILDGEGVALWEPMGLMGALLGSLRYPGEPAPCGIRQRLAGLRRCSNRWEIEHHVGRIGEALFQIPIRAFDEPEVTDVLEDYFTMQLSATQAKDKLWRVALPPMKARRVEDRPDRFCELLKNWARFCALTGAKGLLLIFDEVDVEYASTPASSRLDRERRRRRQQLLEKLGELLGQKRKIPLLLAFGSAPASSDVEEEHDAVLDLKRRIGRMDEIEAPRPDLEQTRELGRRLQALYARAYPDRMSRVDQGKLERMINRFAQTHQKHVNPIPRSFVRGTLERLDVALDLESYAKDV